MSDYTFFKQLTIFWVGSSFVLMAIAVFLVTCTSDFRFLAVIPAFYSVFGIFKSFGTWDRAVFSQRPQG